MFLANVVTGLGSTRALNLPMFTALRRFSIWMTMMGEWYILGREPSSSISFSVYLMVGGAVVAALNDLSFELVGYSLVLANNLFTALNGIYLKRATLSGRYGKLGILYFNSLISGIFVALFYAIEHVIKVSMTKNISIFTVIMNIIGVSNNSNDIIDNNIEVSSMLLDILKFEKWNNSTFLILFLLGTAMGTILNYSTFLCTHYNSALTTTVVGCLKNVLTTYVGMIVMTGYAFTWLNFFGLNFSVIGSIYYTYVSLFLGGNKSKVDVKTVTSPV